jgi:hypothetical protein
MPACIPWWRHGVHLVCRREVQKGRGVWELGDLVEKTTTAVTEHAGEAGTSLSTLRLENFKVSNQDGPIFGNDASA